MSSAQTGKMWLGYPEPSETETIPRISAEQVADVLRSDGGADSIQLIDVRRADLTVRPCPLTWERQDEDTLVLISHLHFNVDNLARTFLPAVTT